MFKFRKIFKTVGFTFMLLGGLIPLTEILLAKPGNSIYFGIFFVSAGLLFFNLENIESFDFGFGKGSFRMKLRRAEEKIEAQEAKIKDLLKAFYYFANANQGDKLNRSIHDKAFQRLFIKLQEDAFSGAEQDCFIEEMEEELKLARKSYEEIISSDAK